MTLREALQAVYDRHGYLDPSLVVDEARAANTPEGEVLHGRLEWDDAVAGEAHRREQASELLRSVKVVYRKATDKDPERSVRFYHAVRGPNGNVYEPLDKVTDDSFLTRLILADMERDWRQMKARYSHFKEFVQMVQRDVA